MSSPISLSRPAEESSLSIIALAENRFGIQSQRDETKREFLTSWLEQDIRPMFAGRTLPVTEAVMRWWRILLEQGRKPGRVFSQPDLIIAPTALNPGRTVVTRNTKDFAGLPKLQRINPWES